jgi:hypothetical protein
MTEQPPQKGFCASCPRGFLCAIHGCLIATDSDDLHHNLVSSWAIHPLRPVSSRLYIGPQNEDEEGL